ETGTWQVAKGARTTPTLKGAGLRKARDGPLCRSLPATAVGHRAARAKAAKATARVTAVAAAKDTGRHDPKREKAGGRPRPLCPRYSGVDQRRFGGCSCDALTGSRRSRLLLTRAPSGSSLLRRL